MPPMACATMSKAGRSRSGPVWPKPGRRGVDERGPARVQHVPAVAQALEHAGPEVLDQHVGRRRAARRRPRGRRRARRSSAIDSLPWLSAEKYRLFPPTNGPIVRASSPSRRPLHLDDARAEVREHERAVGPREDAGQVDDDDAGERPGIGGRSWEEHTTCGRPRELRCRRDGARRPRALGGGAREPRRPRRHRPRRSSSRTPRRLPLGPDARRGRGHRAQRARSSPLAAIACRRRRARGGAWRILRAADARVACVQMDLDAPGIRPGRPATPSSSSASSIVGCSQTVADWLRPGGVAALGHVPASSSARSAIPRNPDFLLERGELGARLGRAFEVLADRERAGGRGRRPARVPLRRRGAPAPLTRAPPALRCTTRPKDQHGLEGQAYPVPHAGALRGAEERHVVQRDVQVRREDGDQEQDESPGREAASRRDQDGAPSTTSATPERRMSSRCAGSQGGIIGR